MGKLVDGVWRDVWYDTSRSGGRFERSDASFRGSVARDGSSGFPAASGRYHLYVSYACPWAHRTLIFRSLKKLESVIDVSVVEPLMLEHGWEFSERYPDRVGGARFLHEVYTAAKPDYTGRVTVPVLWDTETSTIVCNESSEIIRMLNSELADFTDDRADYYPEAHRDEIDEVNARVYDNVNNGVYKAGFATSQEAYDEAVEALFSTLDELDQRLATRRFLVAERPTEADWRLFTTLVRFDPVYVGHFKCNLRRLVDYEHLWPYTKRLMAVPGVRETTHFDHIKRHYYGSHRTINPSGIVPRGPILSYD